MMKNTFLFVLILLNSMNVFAQKWDHIFGFPNTNESFKDMIEYYDMGYLISGSYEQETGNWIIKTDINGQMLWEKIIKWDDVLVFRSDIDLDTNGNIYCASAISGSAQGYWPMITKLNACGEKEWCRVYPHADYEFGWYEDVLVLENQDVVALSHFETTAGNYDHVFLDYIDSNGNRLWRQVYASQHNYPLIRSTGGYEIKRYGDHYLIHGYCYYPYPSNPGHFYLRPMFVLTDSLFNEQWTIPFGVSDSLLGEAFGSIQLNDSVFMGVGQRRLPASAEHSLLFFFDIDGNELGYKEIPNDSIGPDISQNYMLGVERVNDSLFIALTSFAINNELAFWGELKIDTSGRIYKQDFRPVGTNGATKVIKTFDGKYTFGSGLYENKADWDIYMTKMNQYLEQDTLYPGTYIYDSLCKHTIESGNIDISDCLIITDINDPPNPAQYYESIRWIPVQAYPNPVTEGKLTLEFENTEHHQNMELRCYDDFGRQVHSRKIYKGQQDTDVDVSGWPPGIYIAVVYSDGTARGKAKFVVR